jgi:hypothetical protein
MPALAAKPAFPAALLIPRTGQHAALGRSMERAALLVQGASEKGALLVFDTGGTPEGAAVAAKQALKRKVALICGPVFAAEVRPVIAAVGGRVPVMAFSNDAGLLESGAFLLGISAAQSVSAIMRYARSRGIRRIAVQAGSNGWSGQAAMAAAAAAAAIGVEIVSAPANPGQLLALADNDRPDALLMGTGSDLANAAAALRGSGLQLLGAFQGLDYATEAVAALDGAWLSAPDPVAFGNFARSFEARNGSAPGTIAGLAYDAAAIAATLRRGGGIDRSGLLAASGFKGVCGDVRFRDDGSASRAMAILAVDAGAYRVVDRGVIA